MTKITLNDLSTISGNEQSAINLINSNNATIETASDNTLSRDGTSPNNMLADLDMNSFHVLNLANPVLANDPVRLQDMITFAGGGSIAAFPTTSSALRSIITDEVGTGFLVFNTSPTLITPVVTTKITVPLVVGDTTAAGQLTLQSTSNVSPASDFIIFKTGGTTRLFINSAGSILSMDSSVNTFGGRSNYQAYNTHGFQNFIGYTRTSDDVTSGGCVSGYLVAENDSGSGPQTAWGLYAEGRAGNFGFTAGAEIDVQNTSGVTARVIDPNSMFGSGSAPACFAIWSQADGTKAAVTPKDSSAWAGVIKNTTSNNRFLKGLVFDTDVIQTVSGHKEAINFGANQEIVWYSGGGATARLASDGNTVTVTGSLSRGAPVTKTNDFTVAVTENWLICNKASTTTVTLPTASSFTGREIYFKTLQAQTVVSASSNVCPNTTNTPGTAILPATAGAWCIMVSDGTNWIRMASSTIA